MDLRGWPLNSENGKSLLYSDKPNDVSKYRRTEGVRGDCLIERTGSVWVQKSST